MSAKETQDSKVVRGFFVPYNGKDISLEIDRLCNYEYLPMDFKICDRKKFWSFVLHYVMESADFKKSEFYKSLTQQDWNKLSSDLVKNDIMSGRFDRLDAVKNAKYLSKVHSNYPGQIN